ncbi:MAG TPA: VIT1/CCC1 transporter family protein [Acidimicrobiales bacterium]|nr:VIT1/CCC1 transporter family protein [Acidimicrobiales bacterium]
MIDDAPSLGHQHRDISGGWMRAAVFGVSDGLVSNVSLILGFAGASAAVDTVRLAGIAGLVAGAVSMAAGEYVSVRAQAELLQRELDLERHSLHRNPELEVQELIGIYTKRGFDADVAEAMARNAMATPELALETHAREEIGVDPESLGSPVLAAFASFVAFTLGAVLPLLPWFWIDGTGAIIASVVLGAVGAFGVGLALGSFTGRSKIYSASRQLLIAAIAAAVTTAIGYWVG